LEYGNWDFTENLSPSYGISIISLSHISQEFAGMIWARNEIFSPDYKISLDVGLKLSYNRILDIGLKSSYIGYSVRAFRSLWRVVGQNEAAFTRA